MPYMYECRKITTKDTPEPRWGGTLSVVGDKIILFGGYFIYLFVHEIDAWVNLGFIEIYAI